MSISPGYRQLSFFSGTEDELFLDLVFGGVETAAAAGGSVLSLGR